MNALNRLGAYKLLGSQAAYLPARLSPHLGVIASQGELRPAAVQAGQAFERLWLRATQMNLAFQPFAAPALYALPQFDAVSPSVRERLRSTWATLIPMATPLIMFRLGRAGAASQRAGRPPLSHFLEP